ASELRLISLSLVVGGDLTQADSSVVERSDSLNEQGYRDVAEDEYIKYTMDKEKATDSEESDKSDKKDEKEAKKKKEKADEDEDNDDEKEDDDDQKKEKATIKIDSGVVAPDIADDL